MAGRNAEGWGGHGFWEQGPGKVPEWGAGLDSGSIAWGGVPEPPGMQRRVGHLWRPAAWVKERWR